MRNLFLLITLLMLCCFESKAQPNLEAYRRHIVSTSPPASSARAFLRDDGALDLEAPQSTLWTVSRQLRNFLAGAGFSAQSWFLVTDSTSGNLQIEGFAVYIKSIAPMRVSAWERFVFGSPPQRHRFIMFYVTKGPLAQRSEERTYDEMSTIFRVASRTPAFNILRQERSAGYECNIFIAEYREDHVTGRISFVEDSGNAEDQLRELGLLQALGGR